MRDERMYYRFVDDRLESARESTSIPDRDKLLGYLFLSLAYELKKNNDSIIYQEPVWSDPETTFSIVIYRSGHEAHDYCCSCIDVLGARYERECGPVTTAYTESSKQRDEVKSRFKSLLNEAKKQLSKLYDRTPQEYFFLKTKPVIKEIASTANKHFVVLQAVILDAVDMLCTDETLDPWADYERIRDYFEITVEDNGKAEIKMFFYRIRKQKKFVRYLRGMGV